MFRSLMMIFTVFIIVSTLGGLAFLLVGVLLSQIDFLGITPFQGAIICVGTSVIVVFFFWATASVPSFLTIDDEDEDEDEEELVHVPQQRRKSPSQRRRR